MTRIDFYTGVSDRLRAAAALCGKAVARGLTVLVASPDEATSQALSRVLWSQPPTGFVPHVPAGHPLAAVTPVVLDHQLAQLDRHQVLVNLRDPAPECFSRFERLLEIVGRDEADRLAARARYRHYRDRGYALNSHDMAGKGL